MICSVYKAKSCGIYSPVGVIGASKDSKIVKYVNENILRYYEPNNYNSIGPFMFLKVLNQEQWTDKIYNAPSDVFYPIAESYLIGQVYGGMFEIPKDSFALHWYGGHKLSQQFNLSYTEESVKNSKDTISKVIRRIL